jgi:hypothetical protein
MTLSAVALSAILLAQASPAPTPVVGVAGVLEGNGFKVVFFDQQGKCSPGDHVAVIKQPDNKVVQGCWFKKYEGVWVKWDDGDYSAVPEKAVNWNPEV